MKYISIVFFLAISLSGFTQAKKDSLPVKREYTPPKSVDPPKSDSIKVAALPDSVLSLPDIIIVQIPKAYFPFFDAVMNDKEDKITLEQWKATKIFFNAQVQKQLIKKSRK